MSPVALVTGAARGIGAAIAEALEAKGFTVVRLDRSWPAAKPEDAVAADISEVASLPAIVDEVMRKHNHIDCLVNNAGIGAAVRGDLLDLPTDSFDQVMAVNLRGTVFLSQAVARAMRRPSPHPRTLITITSVSAELASPERLDYCMSKAALSMFVKGLALRLAEENIGVFEVRPGIIRSDMTAPIAAAYDERMAQGLVPARRWGEPADVAAIVAGLADGSMNFATGSVIHADGGLAIPRL